jgi:7-cyano-7-deazaguanine synthase
MARADGFACFALSFRYGQRHGVELAAARRVAVAFGAQHAIVEIDLTMFGGSALTDARIAVPHHGAGNAPEASRENGQQVAAASEIPVTYVPARNTIFLSFALAWAETLGAGDIFIGVSAVDYSGYPDCRPEYIAAYERMANLATKAAVSGESEIRIRTPLVNFSKAETIQRGLALGVDYGMTHSCYDPGPAGAPCGTCDSCLLRRRGFSELGVQDPLLTRQRA